MHGLRVSGVVGMLLSLTACTDFVGTSEPAEVGGSESTAGPESPGGTSTGSTEVPPGGSGGGEASTTTNPEPVGSSTSGDPVAPGSTGGETSTGSADDTTGGTMGSMGEESSTGLVEITCETLAAESSGACSQASIDSATLTVTNDCASATVELYWVGFVCGETWYATLGPGESYNVPSFDTHVWLIRDEVTGTLLREIAPLTGSVSVGVLPE
jgi:hypothetical protein